MEWRLRRPGKASLMQTTRAPSSSACQRNRGYVLAFTMDTRSAVNSPQTCSLGENTPADLSLNTLSFQNNELSPWLVVTRAKPVSCIPRHCADFSSSSLICFRTCLSSLSWALVLYGSSPIRPDRSSIAFESPSRPVTVQS